MIDRTTAGRRSFGVIPRSSGPRKAILQTTSRLVNERESMAPGHKARCDVTSPRGALPHSQRVVNPTCWYGGYRSVQEIDASFLRLSSCTQVLQRHPSGSFPVER